MQKSFYKNYEKWEKQCMNELNEQGYNVTLEDIEICEDGQIHFLGNFYLSDKLVIEWNKSEFYTE